MPKLTLRSNATGRVVAEFLMKGGTVHVAADDPDDFADLYHAPAGRQVNPADGQVYMDAVRARYRRSTALSLYESPLGKGGASEALDRLLKASKAHHRRAEAAGQLSLFGGTRKVAGSSQPPAGYHPIPGSKKGGYRRKTAKGYDYWYPDAKKKGAKKTKKERQASGFSRLVDGMKAAFLGTGSNAVSERGSKAIDRFMRAAIAGGHQDQAKQVIQGLLALGPPGPKREILKRMHAQLSPTPVALAMAKAKAKAPKTDAPMPTGRQWIDHAPGLPMDTAEAHRLSGKGASAVYTPERTKLHEAIIEGFIEKAKPVPPDRTPVALFLMGVTASGKSSAKDEVDIKPFKDLGAVDIDPDAVKKALPEYDEAVKASAKDAAKMAHAESSDVADKVGETGLANRMNVVFDGTGKNLAKMRANIARAKALGYRVMAIMPHVTLDTAKTRADIRAEDKGRYVPHAIIEQAHAAVPGNFMALLSEFDEFSLFDNNGEPPPSLMLTKGAGGQPEVQNAAMFEAFQREAGSTLDVSPAPSKVTSTVGTKVPSPDNFETMPDTPSEPGKSYPPNGFGKLERLMDEGTSARDAVRQLSDSERRMVLTLGSGAARGSKARELAILVKEHRPTPPRPAAKTPMAPTPTVDAARADLDASTAKAAAMQTKLAAAFSMPKGASVSAAWTSVMGGGNSGILTVGRRSRSKKYGTETLRLLRPGEKGKAGPKAITLTRYKDGRISMALGDMGVTPQIMEPLTPAVDSAAPAPAPVERAVEEAKAAARPSPIGEDGLTAHQRARKERAESRAERLQRRGEAQWQASGDEVRNIPMGQPILVGHHSERRHRRALERQDRKARAAVATLDEAKAAAYAAKRAGSAISSDDPDAVVALEAKIKAAEEARDLYKRAKRAHKKGGWAAVEKLEGVTARNLAVWKQTERLQEAFPSYKTTNMSANIRRMKQRVESLRREAAREEAQPMRGPGFDVVEDREDNRIRLMFDGKPDKATRTKLKRAGFRWSPSAGAWQRQANANGRYAAKRIAKELGGELTEKSWRNAPLLTPEYAQAVRGRGRLVIPTPHG
jgi:predicted ABC-type ATPase